MPRSGSKNYATYDEIAAALRDAKDYAASLVQHEYRAAKAMEKDGDPADLEEAERLFVRDFAAFVGSVRSAREYIKTAANKTRHAAWLKSRISEPPFLNLFEFFRLFINQSLHQYRPRLKQRTKKVQVVGEPGAVLIPAPGGGLMPSVSRVVGLLDATYYFYLDALEHDAETVYLALERQYPEDGVVPLCLRYVEALEQILKNAKRNKRFDSIST